MQEDEPLILAKLTDELIVILEGCIHGQRDAQEKLYRMFSAKMFGICLRYCKDYNEAKDILQDGFMKVFENIKRYEQRGSFEGWVRRIIINTAIEKFRKSKPMILVDKVPEIIEDDNDEIEPEISLDDILKMVQQLPTRYRLVFNLYVFEQMTHKEISEMLAITEGTSKSNLSRARHILQQRLRISTPHALKIS